MGSVWRPEPLGPHIDMLTGFAFPSAEFSENWSYPRLLRGDNVSHGRLRWRGAKTWPNNINGKLDRYWLNEGDIVVALDRTWINSGLKIATVHSSDLPSLLVQRVARLRARKGQA